MAKRGAQHSEVNLHTPGLEQQKFYYWYRITGCDVSAPRLFIYILPTAF